jgi:hypothetical protein
MKEGKIPLLLLSSLHFLLTFSNRGTDDTTTMLGSSGTANNFDEQLPSTLNPREFRGSGQNTDCEMVEPGIDGKTEKILYNDNQAKENDESQNETTISPGNVDGDYNLFLSYAWGEDHETHEKVKILADFLIQQGERPFFDHNNLRGNMKDKISEVLANSPIFVTVLTKEYNEKVKGQSTQDYVYFEMNYSSEVCDQKILIILEESMRDRKKWCARLKGEFANMLYIDLSGVDWKDNDTKSHSFSLFMEEVRRLANRREKNTSQL